MTDTLLNLGSELFLQIIASVAPLVVVVAVAGVFVRFALTFIRGR